MLDATKPVRTRDGRRAQIVATDIDGSHPIVAVLFSKSGHGDAYTYRADGRFLNASTPHEADLVNVDPDDAPPHAYVNVYRESDGKLHAGGAHVSRANADLAAGKIDDTSDPAVRVGCVRVDLIARFDE